jgi:hypothetical protein
VGVLFRRHFLFASGQLIVAVSSCMDCMRASILSQLRVPLNDIIILFPSFERIYLVNRALRCERSVLKFETCLKFVPFSFGNFVSIVVFSNFVSFKSTVMFVSLGLLDVLLRS